MRPTLPSLLVAALPALLAGCAQDDECGSFGVAEPTLASIQQVVFDNSCALSSCHDASGPEADLDLSSAAASHAGLVGVATVTTTEAWVRVEPGNVGASYLVNKVRGTGIENNADYLTTEPMPPPYGDLCETNLKAIEDWIADGAPEN